MYIRSQNKFPRMKSLLTCIYDLYELGVLSGVSLTKLGSQESEITFQFSSSLCTATPSPQKKIGEGVSVIHCC